MKLQLLAFLFLTSFAGFTQVGIGTTSPDASSALEISATDKGFLMPRMTTAQKDAIPSPATGLQVFDLDTNSVWSYDGSEWKEGSGGPGKFVDGTDPSTAVYNEGNVGIGMNNTSHRLHVSRVLNTDGANTALRSDAFYNGTGTSHWTYGVDGVAKNIGTGTINYAIGTQGRVENQKSGGNINYGVGSWPQLYNSGTISWGVGAHSTVYNSGTLETGIAQSAELNNYSGSQISDGYSNYIDILNDGTIDNAYGLFIDFSENTGTVTNSFALFIHSDFNRGTGMNYSIYSDSDADSFIRGNVGIGIEVPLRKVHISEALRIEPQDTAPANGGLGDLYVNKTDKKLYFHDGNNWREVQLN